MRIPRSGTLTFQQASVVAVVTALLLPALSACSDGASPAVHVTGAKSEPPAVAAAPKMVTAAATDARGSASAHVTTPDVGEPSYAQAAHVHGEAVLLVVTEAGQVQVRLESPAESVIGFEHPPGTTQEWQQAATAIAALSAHNVLVAGDPDGLCKRMEMTWSTPLFSASALANPPAKSNPTRREIGHAEETHHHDGDVSANEVAQDAAVPAKVEGHSGIEATWRFSCGGTPEWLEQRLLSTFPDLERLEVQLASAAAQRAWVIEERIPGRFLLGQH